MTYIFDKLISLDWLQDFFNYRAEKLNLTDEQMDAHNVDNNTPPALGLWGKNHALMSYCLHFFIIIIYLTW